MRFVTDGYRQAYAINPNLRDLVNAGGGVARRDIVGIWVSSNNSRIIDTDSEARSYGWSEEEQEMVEKHLMSHPDFGMKVLRDRGEQRGDDLLNVQVWKLWFAPDQEIPVHYQEFCEQQSWYEAWGGLASQAVPETSENTCIFTDVVGHSVMRCQEPALEGQDYCSDHNAEMMALEQ
jgi:hypothetical protein